MFPLFVLLSLQDWWSAAATAKPDFVATATCGPQILVTTNKTTNCIKPEKENGGVKGVFKKEDIGRRMKQFSEG